MEGELITSISTKSELDLFLLKNPTALILFFASCRFSCINLELGCGFCHLVISELSIAEQKLLSPTDDDKVISSSPSWSGIASVRCDMAKDLCDSMDIKSYPTLLAFTFVFVCPLMM